ncbi:MAG: glycolate oxidase subunit GlcE [Rudaea sp.]|uniref:glycolate oxidase subunit GlcE n=1 Tax=Rudaea sp. TaxID=2136325 RepID=UPI0039E59E30
MAMEPSLADLRERIVAANAAKTPLRLRGGGTKDFHGEALVGDVLDTRVHRGVVDYEPSELVITARCGTPLAEIETALAQHGQFLPFEPPIFHADATIGGVIAAGLSGPRRASAGAARDFVLGAHLLDAHGELLRFGGQVMKNVAGFDVARLLCGSLGVLGLIAQVSLKALPRPREEVTLRFECNDAEALAMFHRWRAQPLPISATCWHDGIASVRLSGSSSALRAACAALGGTMINEAEALAWWSSLRQQSHEFFRRSDKPLWRLSLPATAPIDASGGDLVEWSGALRWLRSETPAGGIRTRTEKLCGTATLWRGERNGVPMFHPLAAFNLELNRRLKRQFDPNGIFNRGRMSAEF